MPSWEGIEDASANAAAVWLSRCCSDDNNNNNGGNNNEPWQPLRKCDCLALNRHVEESESGGMVGQVLVDGKRMTADLETMQLRYNFVRGSPRQLCKATWFIKEEKKNGGNGNNNNDQNNSSRYNLRPIIDAGDSAAIEGLYQRAVQACSLYGAGLKSVLNEPSITLSADDSKVSVVKVGTNGVCMKRNPRGWFTGQTDLQRGYGEYSVPGEEEEELLGPSVRHLVFVVHGIGEALFSRADVQLPSMVELLNKTRLEIQQRQIADWKRACQAAEKQNDTVPLPPVPSRMEIIPIEWFHLIHDDSTDLMKSLKAATLDSIPALRAIANDVVFDVLMYLTPAFCQSVLECVTEQINALYDKFTRIHPDFVVNDSSGNNNGQQQQQRGNVTLMGHSLGSVITWDLLAVLQEAKTRNQQQQEQQQHAAATAMEGVVTSPQEAGEGDGRPAQQQQQQQQQQSTTTTAGASSSSPPMPVSNMGTWGPSLLRPMERRICFEPANTIFLGSPLGLFLTLRGAHSAFDDLRKRAVEEALQQRSAQRQQEQQSAVLLPATSPFTLPTGALYNIFHPSDPVAYRIEPILLSMDISEHDVPPPMYLTAPGTQVGLHIKVKQFGNEMKKSFAKHQQQQKNNKNPWNSILSSAVTALASVTENTTTSTNHHSGNNGGHNAAGSEQEQEQQQGGGKTISASAGEGNSGTAAAVNGEPVVTTGPMHFPLGGTSTRVDFSLQPGVIDNEYISAVTAHSSYFSNPDLQAFLIWVVTTTRSKEQQQQDASSAEGSNGCPTDCSLIDEQHNGVGGGPPSP